MDIFTHAVVGAYTGYALGYPITGAVAGIAPDIVLGIKRRALPTLAYNVTHSFAGVLVASTAILAYAGAEPALAGLLALLSHLFLDWLTHGDDWAPPLAYPFRKRFNAGFGEWEWFDDVWWLGASAAFAWCLVIHFWTIFA